MALATIACITGCGAPARDDSTRPLWVATIPPLADAVRAVAGDAGTVLTVLPPGASPHHYAPKPSVVAQVERARAVFFVEDSLDGWIVRYAGESRVPVFSMVSESARLPFKLALDGDDHDHGGPDGRDPHFWTDPVLMIGVAEQIAETMATRDPSNAAGYAERATAYIAQLTALHEEIEETLAPVKGRSVMLVHSSLTYFLHRYGIAVAGYVEPMPGRKPSPQALKALIDTARNEEVRAVFSETQLPRQGVAAIAEALNLPLYELDPLGGVDGRTSYGAMMRYNAQTVRKALE